MKPASFDHELPDGKVVRDPNVEDLFKDTIQQLKRIRRHTIEALDEVINAAIGDMEEYRKLALKRGSFTVVFNDLEPVDIIFQSKINSRRKKKSSSLNGQ